jgi:hypothetical protein
LTNRFEPGRQVADHSRNIRRLGNTLLDVSGELVLRDRVLGLVGLDEVAEHRAVVRAAHAGLTGAWLPCCLLLLLELAVDDVRRDREAVLVAELLVEQCLGPTP